MFSCTRKSCESAVVVGRDADVSKFKADLTSRVSRFSTRPATFATTGHANLSSVLSKFHSISVPALMSYALLLRFLTSSYFSINIALQYLRQHHDHIGITYYLTRRLKECDINELRESWGSVCHLLVTMPSKSRALECMVVEISERSPHMAIFVSRELAKL